MAAPEEKVELKNRRPTALVAGGAGFLGSHLVRALISQNFHVVVIDNLSTGKKENLKEILTSPNLTFLQEDINNPNLKLPSEIKIDYCFHLASSEDYQQSDEFSLDTLLVNSLGTRQLLEIARTNEAKFILVSSADLYSGAMSSSSLRFYFGKSPENESVMSLHEAKRFAEALTFEYYKKFNLPVTVLRLKDVYGPKMNFDRGDELASLIGSALKREKLKVYGDGLKTLNPTFVSDVVFGLVKASVGNYNGDIFILVNPEKITVENFANTLKLVAGPLEVEHKKEDENVDLPFTHLDLENTKEKLNWTPKVTLAEGLSTMIQNERMESVVREQPPVIEPMPLEIDVAPAVEKKTVPVEIKKGSSSNGRWVRIGVFAASLLLLVTTVVYPVFATTLNSWWGSNDLQQAVNYLQTSKNQPAVEEALKAQNFFESAETNLQNVSWLSKIVGLDPRSTNFDHLLQAEANLSQAIQNSANASSILIDAAGKDNLNSDQALAAFNKVLSSLYTSKDKLEQTQLLLGSIDWSSVPSVLSPTKDFLNTQTTKMQDQVDQLINSIEALT